MQYLQFSDLEFTPHKSLVGVPEELVSTLLFDFKNAKQSMVTFANGYTMSILFGKVFYSNGIDTYEAWCSEVDDEPRGYLSAEEVSAYILEVQKLPEFKG